MIDGKLNTIRNEVVSSILNAEDDLKKEIDEARRRLAKNIWDLRNNK